MSTEVLFHPRTRPTGRKLARALGITGATRTSSNVQTVLRWGSQRAVVPSSYRSIREINGAASLRRSSDKLASLRAISDAAAEMDTGGVCPYSASPDSLIRQAEELSWSPILLGRSRHGSKGKDIKVYVPYSIYNIQRDRYTNLHPSILPYTTHDSLRSHEFYSLYVPNTREYRIHVFRDRILRVQGKYLDFPEQHNNPYVQNYDQGFRFRAPNRELRQSRLDLAIAAVRALGLDFGAVDMLIGEDGKGYVLEVNSAPACSPLTLTAYADAFADELDLSVDRDYIRSLTTV